MLGIQGETIIGTQGAIVTVPKEEAITDDTAGFEGVIHIPNDITLTNGEKSIMLPRGQPPPKTFNPKQVKGDGTIPNAHLHNAPVTTIGPDI